MSQIPDPTGQLTPDAQKIYANIVGTRGHNYPGLFRSLLNYPALAERFADLGKLLRFDGVLRADVRELAILTVAREWQIAYEWETHQQNALRAGLTATLIADVLAGRDLATANPLYAKVQQLARHFLRLEPVPQPLQDELVAALGMPGFIQLSVVINYYRMIFGLAIGFEFPLPEGMSDPFKRSPVNR
jgi:4-carboxymuconolactone decarboxylase